MLGTWSPVGLRLVMPFQVTQCYDTDNPAHLQPQNVLQDSAPKKRRRKESHVNPGTLLTWLQKQVENYELAITDMTTSFQNGLALCAIGLAHPLAAFPGDKTAAPLRAVTGAPCRLR